MARIKALFRTQPVLLIAATITLITFLIMPPTTALFYALDVKTLASLFAMMGVIAALRSIHVFETAASWMLKHFHSTRRLIMALVFLTFGFSMFIANDMALLTFLPFTFLVLKDLHQPRLILYSVVLQNIGANLGGMLTPFGNPQNLYLYSYFNIPTDRFLQIMILPFLLSIGLLFLACLIVKPDPVHVPETGTMMVPKGKLLFYLALFLATLLMVFRVIPYVWGTLGVTLGLLLFRPQSLKEVDYGLLLTFIFFFLITGSLARSNEVHAFLSLLVERSVYWYGILSCQLLSNVPTAVLFSHFTPLAQAPALLLAVNLGGMGTLIASLASLISFQFFSRNFNRYALRYFIIYTFVNVTFLLVLSLSMRWLLEAIGWVLF
ncbi:MAG: SLC13 family permease [Bacilli bacterium]